MKRWLIRASGFLSVDGNVVPARALRITLGHALVGLLAACRAWGHARPLLAVRLAELLALRHASIGLDRGCSNGSLHWWVNWRVNCRGRFLWWVSWSHGWTLHQITKDVNLETLTFLILVCRACDFNDNTVDKLYPLYALLVSAAWQCTTTPVIRWDDRNEGKDQLVLEA